MRQLKGIFIPIITPFENGHFAPSRLTQNLESWNQSAAAGYVVFGSTGEAPLLQETEKLEILRVARQAVGEGKLLIAGTGLESTEATVVFTMRVAELGADAALVLSPSFYQASLSPEAIRRHYVAIAEASPIPVLIYNVPKFTHLNLPLEVIAELSHHPKIAGVKDSAGNLTQLLELRERSNADFQILIGSDAIFFAGLAHHFNGAVLAIANLVPRECVALLHAVEAGEWDDARALAHRLFLIGRILSRYGVPGLKAALDELGYWGGIPRPPLLPVDDASREQIRNTLAQANLLSVPA